MLSTFKDCGVENFNFHSDHRLITCEMRIDLNPPPSQKKGVTHGNTLLKISRNMTTKYQATEFYERQIKVEKDLHKCQRLSTHVLLELDYLHLKRREELRRLAILQVCIYTSEKVQQGK